MVMTTILKSTRLVRGLTAEAVAAGAGLDQSYYSKIENGKVPTAQVARKIARFFGNAVTEHQILYPEDYAPLTPQPVEA